MEGRRTKSIRKTRYMETHKRREAEERRGEEESKNAGKNGRDIKRKKKREGRNEIRKRQGKK